jgi:hypothetical protein
MVLTRASLFHHVCWVVFRRGLSICLTAVIGCSPLQLPVPPETITDGRDDCTQAGAIASLEAVLQKPQDLKSASPFPLLQYPRVSRPTRPFDQCGLMQMPFLPAFATRLILLTRFRTVAATHMVVSFVYANRRMLVCSNPRLPVSSKMLVLMMIGS